MRIRLCLLGVEVLDFATGDHVLDSYGDEAETDDTPKIPAVYGHAAAGDLSVSTWGLSRGAASPTDEPIPEFYE